MENLEGVYRTNQL